MPPLGDEGDAYALVALRMVQQLFHSTKRFRRFLTEEPIGSNHRITVQSFLPLRCRRSS